MTYLHRSVPVSAFAVLVALVAFLDATPAEAQRALQADAPTRVRLDLEAAVGAALGDTRGGAFGLSGQLGVQANDLFAIYWQPGLMVNGWAAQADDVVDVFVFMNQLLMMDFTLGRWFQIGAGGGIDYGSFGTCVGPRNDPTCEYAARELRPAAEGRLAMIIPLPGIRARWGIPITFRAHTTFFSGQQIHTLTLGAGLIRF